MSVDPKPPQCVICGQPIVDELLDLDLAMVSRDPARVETIFFVHEDCLRKVAFPGFIWP